MAHSSEGDKFGFTLLEVVVALAVASILFVSVGASLKQRVMTRVYIEEKAAAVQVAANLVVEFELEGYPLIPEYQAGQKNMGNFLFPWTRTVQPLDRAGQFMITFTVGDQQRPIFTEKLIWVVY